MTLYYKNIALYSHTNLMNIKYDFISSDFVCKHFNKIISILDLLEDQPEFPPGY